jgi:hypothetical protein
MASLIGYSPISGRSKYSLPTCHDSSGKTKANAAPTKVQKSANDHITRLIRLKREHVLARAGSAGQGSRRACHSSAPDRASIPSAKPNTHSLRSDSQTNCGTADTNPAKAAPAPNDTITAGSTQQINVPPLAISVRKLTPTFLRSGAFASETSFMTSRSFTDLIQR